MDNKIDRKTSNTYIQLDKIIKIEIKKIAKNNDRTLSGQINYILKQYISEADSQPAMVE